jgi:DTW domain-containing protein YfiP
MSYLEFNNLWGGVWMDLQSYLERRLVLTDQEPQFRHRCPICLQPEFSCYCSAIRKFDPQMTFAILIHKIELRRRIATGLMSHLCLDHSRLIVGLDYSNNSEVNRLVNDQNNHCVLLYPKGNSVNVTGLSEQERGDLFPQDKRLVVFVIDGTWGTVSKMVRLSKNLNTLPRFCFTPTQPSNFRVRKQPNSFCYSTIEAIHHAIELIGPSRGFETENRAHDNLIEVFNRLVEQQVEFINNFRDQNVLNYRRVL